MNLTTADYALAVSLVALVVGAVRVRIAEKNNTIASSGPWAQLLLMVVKSEVELSIREQNSIKSFFVRSFATIEDKKASWRAVEELRSESAKNLELLRALFGSGSETTSLVGCRATLSSIYDSFLESNELSASSSARDHFLNMRSTSYEKYLAAMYKFSMEVSVGRAGLERKKRFFGLWG